MFPRGDRHLFWSHPRDNGARLQEDGHALRGCWNGQVWCVTWSVNASVYTETKRREPSPQRAVLLAHIWLAVLRDKIQSFDVTTHTPMLPWTIRHAPSVRTRYNVRTDTRVKRRRFVDRNTGKRSCHWENARRPGATTNLLLHPRLQSFGWDGTHSVMSIW